MTPVVIDTSAIMAILLPDERGPMTQLVLTTLERHSIVVPPHWPLEVANALLMAWRRERLVDIGWQPIASRAISIVDTATIHPAADTGNLVGLAIEQNLTVYDAAYVDLAQRLDCPLLTGDKKMRRAAEALKIPIVQ